MNVIFSYDKYSHSWKYEIYHSQQLVDLNAKEK
jgi:hypothetical protein